MRRTTTGIPPWFLAIAAMFVIQFASALSVPVIAQIGPAGTAWLRMCFGALIIWIIVRPNLRGLRLRDLPALLGLGASMGFMTTFFLSAIERIPLGTTVAIEFLGPLTVAGLMSKNRKMLVWPLLALVGVVLLTEPWAGEIDLVGVGFALAAAVCWAFYNLLTQFVGDRFSGLQGLAFALPFAALATTAFGLPQVLVGEVLWWVIPAVAGIALLTPAFAFALEMLALKRMTHTAFGTLLAIEPAIGALMGLIVLAQQPTLLQLAGFVLVGIAGVFAQRGGKRLLDGDPGH